MPVPFSGPVTEKFVPFTSGKVYFVPPVSSGVAVFVSSVGTVVTVTVIGRCVIVPVAVLVLLAFVGILYASSIFVPSRYVLKFAIAIVLSPAYESGLVSVLTNVTAFAATAAFKSKVTSVTGLPSLSLSVTVRPVASLTTLSLSYTLVTLPVIS